MRTCAITKTDLNDERESMERENGQISGKKFEEKSREFVIFEFRRKNGSFFVI
jgi:hypothetical protein